MTTIRIVEYQPEWVDRFGAHAAAVAAALGERALRIEHIGSTSVPGLAAKPIVDILLVVADSAREDTYLPALESAGYALHIREPEWQQHRMLKPPGGDVHLHVYSVGCPEIDRCLVFRDRLRASAADRRLYEDTKRALATRTWASGDAYAAAKTDVVERIIAAAQRGRA